jgi:tetratricopeptide (TPR) repeat protein
VADRDQENRRTRRAQRRAQAEAGTPEGTEALDEGALDDAGDDGESAERDGADASDAADAPKAERTRDRNKRLRERAAAERRARRGGTAPSEDVGAGLATSEMVDDVLARTTHTVTRWVRKNSFIVQSVIALAFVAVVAVPVWRIVTRNAIEKRSDELFAGVEAELARVGEPLEVLNPEGQRVDPRQSYATREEQLAKAESAFRAVAGDKKPPELFAQLGLAGILYDQGKYAEAISAYETVKNAAAAEKNVELKGRALEGIALAQEGKGDTEAALKAYGELENLGDDAFANLGALGRARLLLAKGQAQQAKDAVAKVETKLGAPDLENFRISYAQQVASEIRMGAEALLPKPKAAPVPVDANLGLKIPGLTEPASPAENAGPTENAAGPTGLASPAESPAPESSQ